MIDNFQKIKLVSGERLIPNSIIRTLCDEYWDKPENELSGGNFHIFLEDGNVEDHHILHCLKSALENSDLDGILLGLILLKTPKEQRDPYQKR